MLPAARSPAVKGPSRRSTANDRQLGHRQVVAQLLVTQPPVQPVQGEPEFGGQRCDVRHCVSVPHGLRALPAASRAPVGTGGTPAADYADAHDRQFPHPAPPASPGPPPLPPIRGGIAYIVVPGTDRVVRRLRGAVVPHRLPARPRRDDLAVDVPGRLDPGPRGPGDLRRGSAARPAGADAAPRPARWAEFQQPPRRRSGPLGRCRSPSQSAPLGPARHRDPQMVGGGGEFRQYLGDRAFTVSTSPAACPAYTGA